MAGLGIAGAGVSIGEARVGGGEIAVEAEPGKRLVGGAQLDAFALARSAGSGHRLVAAESRLAVKIEHKERSFDFEVRQRLRSHPDLVAGRLGEQRRLPLRHHSGVALLEVDFGRQRIDVR